MDPDTARLVLLLDQAITAFRAGEAPVCTRSIWQAD
jgi:hypothetical protein